MGKKNTINISSKLNELMNQLGLNSQEVSNLSKVGYATVNRARRGENIERLTADKIFGALRKIKSKQHYDLEKIETLLKAKGVDNINRFFSQMGLNQQYWTNVKFSNNGIGDEVMFGICAFLGVTPDDLKVSDTSQVNEDDELMCLVKQNNMMLKQLMKEFGLE